MTILMLVASLLAVALLIGLGVALIDTARKPSIRDLTGSLAAVTWVLPIVSALGWLAWMVSPHFVATHFERDENYSPANARLETSPPTATDQRWIDDGADLPPWVNSGPRDDGSHVLVPVNGGWRESEAEARNHARQQAFVVTKQDFASAYPGTRSWRSPVRVEPRFVVADQAVESRIIDLGSVEAKMYRCHLQVRLDDELRGSMLSHWMHQVREFRTILLTGLAGLIGAICLASSLCIRYDLKTNGHYRTWLRLATVCFTIGCTLSAHLLFDYAWFRVSV